MFSILIIAISVVWTSILLLGVRHIIIANSDPKGPNEK